MNFSEYISADRTFFFDAFRVVTKTTAMMIFTPERLFIEPRAVEYSRRSTRACMHARAKNINARDYARTRRTFNAYPPLASEMRFAKAL